MDMGAHRVWSVVVDSQRRDHATLFGFQHVGARFCERFFGKELVQIKVCTITRDLVRIFLTPHSSSEQTIRQQHDSVHDSGFDDYLCTTGKLYLRELPCRRLRCNLETAMTTELENVYSIRISGTHKYGLWTRCNQFLDGCKRNWERWGGAASHASKSNAVVVKMIFFKSYCLLDTIVHFMCGVFISASPCMASKANGKQIQLSVRPSNFGFIIDMFRSCSVRIMMIE